ncbi:MAG: repressor LexA [Rubrobacter sp.]|nr:repressor LexA [Rubrobacter sp.]
MDEQLPRKRLEILGFLARGSRASEAPPSIREIARGVGLKSSQTVYHHLGRLEDEGYLERLQDRLRTPRLTEKGWEAALGGDVPLMGRIAAGRGLEAVALEDEGYSLAAELLSSSSGKRRYLLRVIGQSMTEARIEDGDLLVIEEDEEPADGEIVVALLDGGDEVTVKKLYREGGTVRLRPRNGNQEDIIVPAESVQIQGRVIWVFHPPAR